MNLHEPYDAETDTMVPAPRDRTEPSKSSLGKLIWPRITYSGDGQTTR